MTVAYEVESELVWKTNVPEVIEQMMRGLSEVNRALAETRDSLGEMAGGAKSIADIARQMEKIRVPTGALDELRALREATTGLGDLGDEARGVGALARQLSKLEVPTGSLDGLRDLQTATSGLADAQRAMAENAEATARAWREVAEATRQVRIPTGGGNPVPGRGGHSPHGHGPVTTMDAAMGAQIAGDFGMGFVKHGFDARREVQTQEWLAQSDKAVSDAVITRANALIASLQKQYPALTLAEGLHLFRNTMGIFGDPDESLSALPGAVRLQQLYQLAPLNRGGGGGDAAEVQAAEKAGDIMGEFVDPLTHKLDTGLYSKFMDFQARSYQAGGGLVDAKNWLAFARTSRSAGIGLNMRAMEEAQALLEISPGRTGTALQSAFQVFGASTKHMTDANYFEWVKQGLIGQSGNIVDQQLYQSDPFEWVWKDMVPRLKAHGIETRDQILRWLTANGQRSTISGLLSDIAINQTPITRTADKMERQDSNLVDKLEVSDNGRLAALNAAENSFFVALGKFEEGPGTQLLISLTTALNYITDEMNAHPELAKNLVLVGGGLALLAKIGGDVGMAHLFVGGPLIGGLKALAGVATAGTWGSLGLGAAAIGAWALAWEENKPAFEDMLGTLATRRANNELRDEIQSKRDALPPEKRAAFDKLHPEYVPNDSVLGSIYHWITGSNYQPAAAQPASAANTPPWHTLASAPDIHSTINVAALHVPTITMPPLNMPAIRIPPPPPVHVPPTSVPAVHVPPVNVPPITLHAQTLVQIDGKDIPARSTTAVRDALGAPLTGGGGFDNSYSHTPPAH